MPTGGDDGTSEYRLTEEDMEGDLTQRLGRMSSMKRIDL